MESRELSRVEVANLIDDFIEGRGGAWEWDDFVSGMQFDDESLKLVQRRCANLPVEFPSTKPQHYCNDDGLMVLRDIVAQLKAES